MKIVHGPLFAANRSRPATLTLQGLADENADQGRLATFLLARLL
jgi:hypothetical protein